MLKRDKSDINMESVKTYCEGNDDFGKILELFSAGYIPVYNKRKVKLREEVKPFLKRNFFTWYYSAANSAIDVSPARFINSHIFHEFGSDFVVLPIPEPVYKKTRLSGISYKYHVFTMDDHPLIHDIKKFMEVTRQEGTYDQLDYVFGQAHYMSFLFNICTEIGFIVQKGEDIKINEKKFTAFLSSSKKDQLHKLLSSHLANFLSNIKKLPDTGKLPSITKLIKVLGTSQDIDGLFSSAFPGIMSRVVDAASSFGLDPEDFEDFLHDESYLHEMMEANIEMQMLLSSITSSVFICCGLYFQIIQPEYDSYFHFDELDGSYLASLPPEDSGLDEDGMEKYSSTMSFIAYIKPPSRYNATPMGTKFFGTDYEDEMSYFLIERDEYDDVLEDMMLDRDEIEPASEDDYIMNLLGRNLFDFIDTASDTEEPGDDEVLQFPSQKS